MGNGTLGHRKLIRNILHTEFFSGEKMQNPDSGRVAEYLKKLGKFIECIIISEMFYLLNVHLQKPPKGRIKERKLYPSYIM